MRTATAGQLTDLAARQRKELVRVKVANSAAALVDMTGNQPGLPERLRWLRFRLIPRHGCCR